MKCINCGKESKNIMKTGFLGFMICKACDDVGNQMSKMFEQGLEFEYIDGTKETMKFKE